MNILDDGIHLVHGLVARMFDLIKYTLIIGVPIF